MLVDERDTADVNGDDRLLKRVENALRLLDNSILVPPKLYNFKLTKMQKVMQKAQNNCNIEAQRDEAPKSFVFNQDSVKIPIFVIDHPVGPDSRYNGAAYRENGRVFVLIDEVKTYLNHGDSKDLNNKEQSYGATLKFGSLIIPVDEREEVPDQQQKLDELNELRFIISF